MRNNPLYIKLKQIALKNYTVEQVENATMGQVAQLLGPDVRFSQAFFQNMKRGVIMALQNRDDENDMQQLKQTSKIWLDENFPDWSAERGKEGDKPYVTIWLKGKPQWV